MFPDEERRTSSVLKEAQEVQWTSALCGQEWNGDYFAPLCTATLCSPRREPVYTPFRSVHNRGSLNLLHLNRKHMSIHALNSHSEIYSFNNVIAIVPILEYNVSIMEAYDYGILNNIRIV